MRSRLGVLVPLGLAALTGACQEAVTAPGACPDFCPASQLVVHDTILRSVIERDESVEGYVLAHHTATMQVARDDAGASSWALVRFPAFPREVVTQTATYQIVTTDSFRVNLVLARRTSGISGLQLAVHRLPITVDSTTGFAEVMPFFADSTRIGSVTVDDTLASGGVSAVLPGDAFPSFEADSLRTAIGIELSTGPGLADLYSAERGGSEQPQLTRFVTVDSSGQSVPRTQVVYVGFDSYVAPVQPPAGPDVLRVGGVPSARAFLRVSLPRAIRDSSIIIQATLILVPVGPVLGAVSDSLPIRVFRLAADVGPKSLYLPAPADPVLRGVADVPVGSSDTVRIDVTHMLRSWQQDTTLARTLLLRAVPEAGRLAEGWFGSTRMGASAPALQITLVPLKPEPGP